MCNKSTVHVLLVAMVSDFLQFIGSFNSIGFLWGIWTNTCTQGMHTCTHTYTHTHTDTQTHTHTPSHTYTERLLLWAILSYKIHGSATWCLPCYYAIYSGHLCMHASVFECKCVCVCTIQLDFIMTWYTYFRTSHTSRLGLPSQRQKESDINKERQKDKREGITTEAWHQPTLTHRYTAPCIAHSAHPGNELLLFVLVYLSVWQGPCISAAQLPAS